MFINLFIYYRIQIIYVCISLQVTVYYIYVCMQDVVLIFKYFYYSNCIYKTYYFPLLCTCLYGYIYLRMEILRRCHSFLLLLHKKKIFFITTVKYEAYTVHPIIKYNNTIYYADSCKSNYV